MGAAGPPNRCRQLICRSNGVVAGERIASHGIRRRNMDGLIIKEVDAQGADALALLREAAMEVRALYPEAYPPGSPWPTNSTTPGRGAYLVAYIDGEPVACGALRPLDEGVVEIRRMFVVKQARRRGLGRAMLRALESAARRLDYKFIRLETGNRQVAAMSLYLSHGFARIEPFGVHIDDPTSVCYEKAIQ
jgi:GNAT superfamily N-acetyltransferase